MSPGATIRPAPSSEPLSRPMGPLSQGRHVTRRYTRTHRRRTVVARSTRRLLLNPKFFRNGIVMLVLVVGTAALLFTWLQSSSQPTTVGYSAFLDDVKQGNVQQVVQQGDTLTVK